MASALPWFPVVGLLLGGLLYGLSLATEWFTLGRWPEASAVAVLIASALLTRGLHLDGLADWADGFWGGMTKEKTLAIMKDSAVGSFGAIALICVLLAKWVCITRLLADGAGAWIVAACVGSRTMQVQLAALNPYARAEGGTAAPYVDEAGMRHALSAIVIAAAMLAALFRPELIGLLALAVGVSITTLFGLVCRRRIGGVTGDLIGTCSELVETAFLAFGVLFHVVLAEV